MVRNIGEFIDCVKRAVKQFGTLPDARVIARKGDFGAEHAVEHIKVRNGRNGPELIIQIAEIPNAS